MNRDIIAGRNADASQTFMIRARFAMWIMSIPVLLCSEAVWHDVKKREIPDGVSLRILATGLLSTALGWHAVTLSDAVLGALIGFCVVLPFTLHDGIGGGDLKLVAALGAWLGPSGTLQLLFWTALAGMVAALITALRGQKDFAYAPAILAGLLIVVLFPTGLSTLVESLRR